MNKRSCHLPLVGDNLKSMVSNVRISTGLRIGFWSQTPVWGKTPFECVGHYNGANLGDHVPGAALSQELMEGTLKFRVGVLFRPDLGSRSNLETILILEHYIPEMFEYEDWEAA